MGVIAGLDVGATAIAGGLVDAERGEILAGLHIATRGGGGRSPLDILLGLVSELGQEAAVRGLVVDAVGVGLPGLVDAERGMMVSQCNLVPEFAHVPLADRLAASTGLPVFVDNDVNALTLGEWFFGAGRGTRSLVVLAVGTGIGGGLILDGALVRGAGDCAGELGHLPIDFRGPRCFCGGRGCLNVYASGLTLAAEARRRLTAGAVSSLRELAGGDQLSARHVFQAAAAGDALGRELVEGACLALGAALGAIVNTLNPEMIVVTGGVAESLLPLEREIGRHAARYALGRGLARTRVVVAPADKRRTVLGGVALARYELARRAGKIGVPAPAAAGHCRVADAR